jgi:hypothetical protein
MVDGPSRSNLCACPTRRVSRQLHYVAGRAHSRHAGPGVLLHLRSLVICGWPPFVLSTVSGRIVCRRGGCVESATYRSGARSCAAKVSTGARSELFRRSSVIRTAACADAGWIPLCLLSHRRLPDGCGSQCRPDGESSSIRWPPIPWRVDRALHVSAASYPTSSGAF